VGRAGLEPAGLFFLGKVRPQPAHRVMDRREDLHRLVQRVGADEFFIDLENAFEPGEDGLTAAFLDFVAKIEVDHVSAAHAQALLADFEDLAGGNVARDNVAVLGIPLFQDIVTLVLGDVIGIARIVRLARHPDAAAFAAGRLADQPALVLARYGGGVDLDHLRIAIAGARLVAAGDRAAAERADLHRPHVLRYDADALAIMNHRPEEFPKLVLCDLPLALMPAGLLVQGIQKLLS